MNPISMSSPDINEDDVRAVTAVLRSGQLALGPQAVAFERLVADYAGVKHGTWATISAVVIAAIPPGATAAGVPARVIKTH